MIFMHSVVSTNLENLNLLTALKYTDKEGVTRDLTLYTWNGKLVIVDDGMPTEQAEDGSTVYTSYVLGEGTINYEDIGAKVPYRCVQEHTSQEGWEPDKAASLWAVTSDPAEEWPAWSQPLGAHDAYSAGAKVNHKGKHWTSTVDGNVWEPGVYGWDEVTE